MMASTAHRMRAFGRAGPRLAWLLLGLWLHGSAGAECKVSTVELPITMVGSRAVASLGINGASVPMTVDSGAAYSMLTDAAAAQLKLPFASESKRLLVRGLTGLSVLRVATVERLKLLDGEMPNVDFVVGGGEPGAGTMGLLGRNVLANTDVEYDLAHGAIRFVFPNDDCKASNMAYWAEQTPVSELALRIDGSSPVPAIEAVARLNDQDIRVLFDTGATSVITLGAARRAGVTDADLKPAGQMRGIGTVEVNGWTAPFRTFSIGRETSENNRLQVGDFRLDGVDMLLGVDFFLSHRIFVSKSQRRMFFTYNGGSYFALNGPAATAEFASGLDEPTDAAGFARRAAARAARRDFVHALEDLDRACALAPAVAEQFTQRGLVHLALKQRRQAEEDFETALTLDPAQTDARWQRATRRASAGDRAGALDDLRLLDSTLAPQAFVRIEMARLYLRFDMKEQALAQLNAWIPVHRNEARLDVALNERCWIRTLLDVDRDEVMKDCDGAVDRKPDEASYLGSRGWAKIRRGAWRDAYRDFDRALKVKPESAWSLYGRGIARIRIGFADEGRADIEAARKLLSTIDAETGGYGLAVEAQTAAAPP